MGVILKEQKQVIVAYFSKIGIIWIKLLEIMRLLDSLYVKSNQIEKHLSNFYWNEPKVDKFSLDKIYMCRYFK